MNIKKAIPYMIFFILIFIIVYQRMTNNFLNELIEVQNFKIINLEKYMEISSEIYLLNEFRESLYPDTLIIGNDTLRVRKDSVDVLNETRFK